MVELKPVSQLGQYKDLFSLPITFAKGIPKTIFHEEEVDRKLRSRIAATTVDNPGLLLMAVPGAGKTRTVDEAATVVGAILHRQKLVDGEDFVRGLQHLAEEPGPPSSYKKGKDMFVPACKKYVASVLKVFQDTMPGAIKVLHFDEVQVLMGEKVVSKERQSKDLFDYVMPAFGDAINTFTSRDINLRVVLSGTNFFTHLVFNSGSQLKCKEFQLDGGFPLDFAKKELLRETFDLGSVPDQDQDDIILPMCANRRATELLAYELEVAVGVGNAVSVEQLKKTAEDAYAEWSKPIMKCIENARQRALALLALILYPSAWNAEIVQIAGTKLRLPSSELPDDVKEYALAGAVNMVHETGDPSHELITVPVGCTKRFLWDLCKKVTRADNMIEFEAFRRVSRSVETEKGHLFERMIACEVTFLSSGLIQTLLSPTGKGSTEDSSTFGKTFEYNATIHEINWEDGRSLLCG